MNFVGISMIYTVALTLVFGFGVVHVDESSVVPFSSLDLETLHSELKEIVMTGLRTPENAWLRLKPARLLHDAVPNPPERDNFPMHIKIARRRFQQSPSSRPYGWLYCGSHNFSPAAWGRPLWKAVDYGCVNGAAVLGSSLQISNYELGIAFMEPPDENIYDDDYLPDSLGIDKFLLPFQTPPPPYKDEDRPATGKAMNEALLELQAADEALDVMESEVPIEDEASNMQLQEFAHKAKDEEEKAEEEYVVALWSQIDDLNE